MVRTKYLVITIVACVVLIFFIGILPPSQSTATHDSYIGTHAVFTTPKEKYTIAGTSLDARIEERQAFKERVQATLRAEPVVLPEEEVMDEDRNVTTPSEILPTAVIAVIPPIQMNTGTSASPTVMDSATTAPTSVPAPIEIEGVVVTTTETETETSENIEI